MGLSEMAEEKSDRSVSLITFGGMDREILSFLPGALGEILLLDAHWGAELPIPSRCYRAGRRQYLSGPFLVAMATLPAGGDLRLLGITDVDLFTPGLNFIFGQAAMGGRECIVSTARLHPSFYGEGEDPGLFRERVVKEAVHELGHTFGLEHCDDAGCVMCFSNSLADTDRKVAGFCPRCRRLYLALLEKA